MDIRTPVIDMGSSPAGFDGGREEIRTREESYGASLGRILSAYWSLPPAGEIPDGIRSGIALAPRSDGAVAFLPAWSGKPRAFLKILGDRRSFENEIECLRIGASAAMRDFARVPAILLEVPSENGLILELVEGNSLDAWVRRMLFHSHASLDGVFSRLGSWLRCFHDARVTFDESGDFARQLSARIDARVAGLAGVLGPRLTREVDSLAHGLNGLVRKDPMPIVACHGDFQLENCIVDGAGLWMTDFAYMRPGPREMDIERLWDSVEDAVGVFPATGMMQARIRKAFRNGYGPGGLGGEALAGLIHLELTLDKIFYLNRDVPRAMARRIWRSYLGRRTVRRLEQLVQTEMKR